MIIRKIILASALYAACIITKAQQTSLVLLAKYKAEGVWLRWAPPNAAYWLYGNKTGYVLERFTLLPDGNMEEGSRTTLTSVPLKVYTSAQFDVVSQTSDEAGALQELLYGNKSSVNSKSNDLGTTLRRNKELDNKHGMAMLLCDLSAQAASAAALSFIDKTTVQGKRYVYRVKFAQPDKEFNAGTAIVNTNAIAAPIAIRDFKVTFGNRKATLRWPTLLHKGEYSAYYIERSEDGKKFRRLSDLPYVHMTEGRDDGNAYYIDSLAANNKKYFYRIQGINLFAEVGPYSTVISGEGQDDLTGLLVIRKGEVLANRHVRIQWEFPAELKKRITGFIISQAASADGPYKDMSDKKVLPVTMRDYTQAVSFNNSYFAIRGVDAKGQEIVRSFPYLVQIADETPPAIPANLTGSVDKSGVVSLQWTANLDSDLLGYRVFRTNSLEEEPSEVTKEILLKPFFTDSLNIHVLNKKVHYAVVAVDRNYNPSDYSPMIVLNRPDVMPPAAPVFTKTSNTQDTIELAWQNSISDDVARYELIKIEKEARLSRTLLSWYPSNPLTAYRDQSLTPGNTYQYRIIVYDSAGNSRSAQTREIFFEPGYREGVSQIKNSVDRDTRAIVLSWKNVMPITRCMVYRKINDGPLKIFATMEGNVSEFSDREISPNNIYTYKIQPVYSKRLKGVISKAVIVTY
jgi:hypothetical protein